MQLNEIFEHAKKDFESKTTAQFFSQKIENIYLKFLIDMYEKENKELRQKVVLISNQIGRTKTKMTFFEHLENINKYKHDKTVI